VRFIYLDEAGISNPMQEPFVVVAGAIVHADKQWKFLERYLNDMKDDLVDPERRHGFVFHATELFSGGGNFPREIWPREERWKILDELISIGDKFDLPYIYGSVKRAEFSRRYPQYGVKEATTRCQVISFLMCMHAAQHYMAKKAPDEVATVVMENNDGVRSLIGSMHGFIRDPNNIDFLRANGYGRFVLDNIVDDVHFSLKGRSSPLQVADAAAFVIKRHLMDRPESDRFYQPLKKRLVMLPKSELPV
jgi:hypothetical protein